MATVTYGLPVGGLKATISADGNTGTITVAGNNSTSNLTSNSSEVVVGATITKVIYGSGANSYWTLKRGSNTVGVYYGTGVLDYKSHGIHLALYANAAIAANIVGTSQDGYIIIETNKETTFV